MSSLCRVTQPGNIIYSAHKDSVYEMIVDVFLAPIVLDLVSRLAFKIPFMEILFDIYIYSKLYLGGYPDMYTSDA